MKKQLIVLYILLISVVLTGIMSIILFLEEPDPVTEEADEYIEIRDMVMISEEPVVSLEKTEDGKPDIYIPEIDVDVEALLAANSDYKGWLHIPETGISLPVVMGDDNNYYLKRTFYGYYSDLGCLYYDTASVEGSQNRVIYGHNFGINSDSMFSPLINYQDQMYADEHKYMYVVELDGEVSAYQVYAVVNFDTTYINECDYRQADFETDDDYIYFVEYLIDRSCYATYFVPKGEELLTLQTCNRQYGSTNRLLICGAKIN